jgi:APA family basic amino acid/polyamine antiporter
MTDRPSLPRRLGLVDATTLGLGSMIGAGVFAVLAPAAQLAGAGLLVALVIAGVVAFANATSTAQLAAADPRAGGAYLYGRTRLGEWWGFIAGWGFVIGKIASVAAMALTFAAYAAPSGWERPVAAGTVVLLVAINLLGITRTALATRVIVALVLVVLAVVVVAALSTGLPELPSTLSTIGDDPWGILPAAGLLFFAFAGYARIATLGEEVREPERTIPRAIVLALGLVLVLYAIVAVSALGVLGVAGTAAASAPLEATVVASGWSWASPVVRAGAAVASLGAMLALLAGIGRTGLAMAREGDLPRGLAAVSERYQVPYRAELLVGAVVVVLVLVTDLRGVIGFSSFGVLTYYAIANAAALRQPDAQRRYPRIGAIVGLGGCVLLVVTLPLTACLAGIAVLGIGVVLRLLLGRPSRRVSAPNDRRGL